MSYTATSDPKDDYVNPKGRKSSKYTFTYDNGQKKSYTGPDYKNDDESNFYPKGQPNRGNLGRFSAITGQMDALKGSFKKGGKVKSTGVYKLHKGERVLNKKQAMTRALDMKKKKAC